MKIKGKLAEKLGRKATGLTFNKTMIAGLQKWKGLPLMEKSEKLMFTYELSRLQDDYERCEDKQIKEKIIEDMHMIEEALQLLFRSS